MPPRVASYAAAYDAEQRSLVAPIQFARATRLMQASGDMQAAFARAGVSLADYVRGSQRWSGRMAEDPEVERRFEEALRGG